MTAKAIYDTIASQYATADCFGSITESHNSAIAQIKQSTIGHKPRIKILDLGVGDGAFMRRTRQLFPMAELTGIDVSGKMLNHAKTGLSINTIEASAAEATCYLPNHSQDLVIAHFVNAYIPIPILFKQAQMLTRANGHFSIITTTYESFPVAQQLLADFIARDSILSSIVGHYYKAVVKNTTVATDKAELIRALQHHQFEVVEHQRLQIPITLNSIDELLLFGIEGTWFLNSLSVKILPRNFLLQRIKSVFSKIFTFPYQDTHIIDVILAKK